MTAAPTHQEHTRSYYAASVNRHRSYGSLCDSVDVDVCVVGAGFTGVSTAITLAERGYSVAVLEANRVGWGASGRNGGQLIGGISGEARLAAAAGPERQQMLWELRWRGHDIIHERVERYQIDCDLKRGYIDVAIKPRHLRELESSYDELLRRNFQYPYRLVDRAEVETLLGTQAYIGGLINERDGHLHPLNLCLGEASAAESLGVQLFEHSPAVRIEHGDRPAVVTQAGRVQADAIVLAGNAYHRLEKRHLSGLVFPAGSFIIATEPLSEEQTAEINPRDLAVCDPNYVLDYFRLSADGRLLYGGRCNYSGHEPRSIKDTMLPRMLKIYPQLSGVSIDYEWGGKIGIVIKRVPLLGRIRGNVYYAQGYSGHGVNASHIAGEIIADAIGGTLERLDIFERIRHLRLPMGQWAGNQLVALGMIYFRLRDLL